MKIGIVIINILMLLLYADVFAAEGLYLSANLGVSFPKNLNFSKSEPGLNVEASTNFDSDFLWGAAAGFDAGSFRIEGEFKFMSHELKDVQLSGDVTGTHSGNESISIPSLFFNVFLDIENESIITPYIGAGIGFAIYDWEGITVSGVSFKGAHKTANLYQLGGGIAYQLGENFVVDLAYRYVASDNITIEGENMKYRNSNVYLQLQYFFHNLESMESEE